VNAPSNRLALPSSYFLYVRRYGLKIVRDNIKWSFLKEYFTRSMFIVSITVLTITGIILMILKLNTDKIYRLYKGSIVNSGCYCCISQHGPHPTCLLVRRI
jgi:hypothetical protein